MGSRMRKRIALFIMAIVIICMIQPMSARADETDTRKIVRVACDINNSLYLEDGVPKGYCSEYLNQLAEINHWEFEYVPGSWAESIDRLYNHEIDLLLPTQMTEERIGKMGFSNAIGGYQPIALFVNGDSTICYDDYKGFDGLRIAISEGTSNEDSLKKYAEMNHFTYEPVYMNTTEEKIDAMKNGLVDMVVFSTLNDVEDAKVVAMLDYLPFYYCTNIDDPELLDELNYGMNQMIIRHADLVQEVFYEFMTNGVNFAYTKEEQEEIQNRGKIVVGIYEDTEPLFGNKGNGLYQGIYVDLVKQIQEISGLDLEIRPLERKEMAFDYLDRGEIDVVLGSSDQAVIFSQKDDYIQSEGVMDYYSIQITKMDYQKSDSDPVVIALTNGRKYWEPKFKTRFPNGTIVYYQTAKECLDAVAAGKADLTMINSWEYNYQSKNQRFENLIEWDNTRTLSQTVFISHKSKNTLLLSILNKSIEQITNAQKEQIISANLNQPYSSYSMKDTLYEMKDTLLILISLFLIALAGMTSYLVMRRKSVRELKEKNLLLEESNKSKDLFLSRMSHELRTPLNAINGYATVMDQSLLEHDVDENKGHSYMESIQRAVKYQLAIIGDLLDVQKIESGKFELNPFKVDSAEYIKSIIALITPEAEEKGVEFTFERLNYVNDTYMIDGIRLEQVLLNLLHNAVKFTPKGGKVKMTAEVVKQGETANDLKFVISDTGIGMSEEFQKNALFQRFAQEYKGNTSPYDGCGTGLAISKDIIQLMGGNITCESKQGEGTTFTVTVTANHIAKKAHQPKSVDLSAFDLGGIRVLLCEDNKMNQDMERRLLEKINCKVDVALNGKIGVELFEQSAEGAYDAILMDIRMPVMDGYEATKAIRALNRKDAKTVPILAVSANSFPEDVKKSLDCGMNEHISKPVDFRVLYERIHHYLNCVTTE